MRIAVVTPIPTPYRDGFWNAFAALPNVIIDVFYCAGGKADRPWTPSWERFFGGEVVFGWNLFGWRRADASLYWNPGIAKCIKKGDYDAVIIGGYNHLTMWFTLFACRRYRIPYFMMCETHELRSNGIKAYVRNHLVRYALSGASGGLPTGMLASRFLTHFGIPPENCLQLPNLPDIEMLRSTVSSSRLDRVALMKIWGLDETIPTVVFVGRLIKKKCVSDLISAIKIVSQEKEIQLLVVGDGGEKSKLIQLAQKSGIAEKICFAGFIDTDRISSVYAVADIFAMPSHETWGVAVLEALAVGLKVVVSDRVGCHVDLAEKLKTFKYGEIEELAKVLIDLCDTVSTAGGRGLGLPEWWNYHTCAEKLRYFISNRCHV